MMIHCQVPVPTMVCNGILGALILKDQQVDLHMASWVPCGDVFHDVYAWIPPTSQTLMTLMMKLMLCSYHSQIHGLTRVKVTEVEPPITAIVSGLCSSLAAVSGLIPAVLPEAQAGAPPIIWQPPGG